MAIVDDSKMNIYALNNQLRKLKMEFTNINVLEFYDGIQAFEYFLLNN